MGLRQLIRDSRLPTQPVMSAIRIARTALRVAPSSIRPAIQRRGYADVAADKIQLSLTLPHQVSYYRVLFTPRSSY